MESIHNVIKHCYQNNIVSLDMIDEYYNPQPGYIYCMHNEMFNFYGENVFKLGNTGDTQKRLANYTTSFIEPCKFIKFSPIYYDKKFAEKILFHYLKDYRIKTNREFFKADINIIDEAFNKVNDFFYKYSDTKSIIEHLITDNNIHNYISKNKNNFNTYAQNKKKFFMDNVFNDLNLGQNNFNYDNFDNFLDFISKSIIDIDFNKFNNIFLNFQGIYFKFDILLNKINHYFL